MDDAKKAADSIAAVVESMTPQEQMLFHGTAICMLAKEALEALKNGKQHPAGVYAASGNVLTIDGQPTSYEMVAVMIPLDLMQTFAIAHAGARKSPEGEALAARIQAAFPIGPCGLA